MCDTQFHFFTYNTHLFFKDLAPISALFEDEPRRQALSEYLRTLQPNMINIAALQEVWWAEYAHEIYSDALANKSYTNRYVVDDQGHGLNPPGLMLLGDAQCTFSNPGWTCYRASCGGVEDPIGWDSQDLLVYKGRLHVTCNFQCSEGHSHSIVLANTHMPVGYGSHTERVGCSFNDLASAANRWLGEKNNAQNPNEESAVILLGDLNIDYFRYLQWVANKANPSIPPPTVLKDGNTEYQDAVMATLGSANLIDSAAPYDTSYSQTSAYNLITIDPQNNKTWQKINGNPDTGSIQRIDYFMYANSSDGNMTVTVNNISVNKGITITYDGDPTYQGSDHYPLEIQATISVND